VSTASRPVTVITGGARGIGAAVALALSRAGHDVVIGYRTDREAAADVTALAAAEGARAVPVQADVVRDDDVQRLFATARDELGPVTGLVNNAGLTAHIADLADTPVEAVRTVVDVNLLGSLLCARRAAQVMSTRRGGQGGCIVNISSAAATLGSAHEYVHYAAAKAGVDALTVGLAKELAAEGIRVNGVAPGIVRTGIHAAAGQPGREDRIADRIPFGRPGEPSEIAPAVVWLMSSEAAYVSGATVRVAGGL
jgi:NAD(P)-dependent dehydrogenase (short-subunit alcohol dehydrogenase family)